MRRRFLQLLDALEAARARYAIIGAVAMGAHGVRRFTEDIDVLVAADDLEAVVRRLTSALAEIGREPGDGPVKQVRLRSKRARGPNGVDVDLLVPLDAIESWALATAVRGRAFDRKVDLATPEALIVMKLQAYLSDPDSFQGAKHRVDAMRMLLTTPADVPGLRRFVRSNAAMAAELERVLAAPPPRGRLR
ncbi:MAG TPA: nucleotidyl transferase AbiEii/AbiGii toxin family protein [Kofleriaceae bacterium]|nr:nucleotidyl transferase AbiEii/AbiGii toxin family protein [Kofleriaceae bacterium]